MDEQRQADFLGRGWRFPIAIEPGARVAEESGEEKIRQAIRIILATAKGERRMRPDFGCDLHRLVFSVNEAATLRQAAEEVRQALIRWEARIDLLEVTATPRSGGELLLINVRYRVRATNNLFNLVYPFYLAGSAGI